jgi:hypothetical protein
MDDEEPRLVLDIFSRLVQLAPTSVVAALAQVSHALLRLVNESRRLETPEDAWPDVLFAIPHEMKISSTELLRRRIYEKGRVDLFRWKAYHWPGFREKMAICRVGHATTEEECTMMLIQSQKECKRGKCPVWWLTCGTDYPYIFHWKLNACSCQSYPGASGPCLGLHSRYGDGYTTLSDLLSKHPLAPMFRAFLLERCEECHALPPKGCFTCSGCMIARYCSIECHEAAWSTHKKTCANHRTRSDDPHATRAETEPRRGWPTKETISFQAYVGAWKGKT